jgi:hypothetical protein
MCPLLFRNDSRLWAGVCRCSAAPTRYRLELKIAAVHESAIGTYTTDNGAEIFTWPDGGATPFKGEKATNWEGAFRVA